MTSTPIAQMLLAIPPAPQGPQLPLSIPLDGTTMKATSDRRYISMFGNASYTFRKKYTVS